MIDLWGKSSRDEFIDCIYIKKSEATTSNNKLAYQIVPKDHFRAKIVNSYTQDNQAIAQAFLTEQETVVIESHDDLSEIQINDYVIMKQQRYRVDGLQIVPVKKQQMFIDVGHSATYYITLRR